MKNFWRFPYISLSSRSWQRILQRISGCLNLVLKCFGVWRCVCVDKWSLCWQVNAKSQSKFHRNYADPERSEEAFKVQNGNSMAIKILGASNCESLSPKNLEIVQYRSNVKQKEWKKWMHNQSNEQKLKSNDLTTPSIYRMYYDLCSSYLVLDTITESNAIQSWIHLDTK